MAENPYLASLVAAWGGDETVIPEIETEPFPDETLSPGMSEFIRSARRFLAAMDDEHDFVDAIQQMANRLAEYLTLHRELLPTVPLSFPQMALGHLATQALMTFSDGLAEMVACFSRNDVPAVERGIDRCKQAIIVLEAWWIELARVVRQHCSRVCALCGHVNPPEAAECCHCETVLPPLDDNFHPRHEYLWLPDFWLELYRATRAMVAEKLSLGEWSSQVEELRVQVLDVLTLLGPVSQWDRPSPELLDSYEATMHGLTQLREAVERMQQYTQDRELESLQQGWFQLVCALRTLAQPCSELREELIFQVEDLEAESA